LTADPRPVPCACRLRAVCVPPPDRRTQVPTGATSAHQCTPMCAPSQCASPGPGLLQHRRITGSKKRGEGRRCHASPRAHAVSHPNVSTGTDWASSRCWPGLVDQASTGRQPGPSTVYAASAACGAAPPYHHGHTSHRARQTLAAGKRAMVWRLRSLGSFTSSRHVATPGAS
jgi:hypothetical protein